MRRATLAVARMVMQNDNEGREKERQTEMTLYKSFLDQINNAANYFLDKKNNLQHL